MRRTSFAGALSAVALGGVLAFGIKGTFKDFDIHVAGLIIMLAGIADLVIRFAIANSPLFSPETADVAAVVEPLGEPVLDVFGNPITTAPAPSVLAAPAPVMTPVVPSASSPVTSLVPPTVVVPPAHRTQELPVVVERPVHESQARVEAQAAAMDDTGRAAAAAEAQRAAAVAAANGVQADQVVRTVGDHATDESLVPVSPLTGRPVRTLRRRRRRLH